MTEKPEYIFILSEPLNTEPFIVTKEKIDKQ